MSPAARWALACAVVVLAAIAALLPQVGDSGAGGGQATTAAPAEQAGAEIDAARENAELRPCPETAANGSDEPANATDEPATGEPSSDNPSSDNPSSEEAGMVQALRGIEAVCLGDGQPVELDTALAGETTLINVWATWCPPCLDELPELEAYAQSQSEVDVLGVQVASEPAGGLEMLADLDVRFPSVHDGMELSGPLREALGPERALPVSYLVTPDGNVQQITDPRVFTSAAQIAETVRDYGGPG